MSKITGCLAYLVFFGFIPLVLSYESQPGTNESIEEICILGYGEGRNVAWSQDGEVIAIASTVGLWIHDPYALGEDFSLAFSTTSTITSVAINEESSVLVAGTREPENKLYFYNVNDNKIIFEYDIKSPITDIEIINNDVFVATISGGVQIWNLEHMQELTAFEFDSGIIDIAVTRKDGSTFLAIANQFEAKTELVRIDSTVHRILELDVLDIKTVTISSDAELIITGSENGLLVWNTDGSFSAIPTRSQVIDTVVFSEDEELLAIGFADGSVVLLNTVNWEQVLYLSSGDIQVLGLAFSPDNKTLASINVDGSLNLINVDTSDVQTISRGHSDYVQSLRIIDDNTFISGSADSTLRVWNYDCNSNEIIILQEHNGIIQDIGSSNNTVVSIDSSGIFSIWNILLDSHLIESVQTDSSINAVIFEANNIVFGDDNGLVRVFGYGSHLLPIYELQFEMAVTDLAFSSDADCIYIAGRNGTLYEHHLGETSFSPIYEDTTSISALEINEVYDQIVVGNVAGYITFLDLHDGSVIRQVYSHMGLVNDIAISPDGSMTVSAGDDLIRIWDTESGAEVKELNSHIGGVQSVAFNNDGTILLSGGIDNTIRLWSIGREN